MKLNFIDQLGDWNPQLLRELKGRLKPRNLLIAGAISLLSQFLLFMFWQNQLPILYKAPLNSMILNKYCIASDDGYGYYHDCHPDALGNFLINWQLWWLDLFVCLSVIGIFALLVAGTHMLISDLANEQRRDTLNFIRLSPESTQSILVGKLLGVPILLYFVAVLAAPLHLWSGLSAGIPLGQILGFYAVVFASGILFYSVALLYGLVSKWLGGFQIWLGSGMVLVFLVIATALTGVPINNPLAWSRLLCPFDLIPHLSASSFYQHAHQELEQLQWFYLPLGASVSIQLSVALLNCCFWTYWIWQGLNRCFRNPQATILSKWQSYLLTACFEVTIVGFASPGWATEAYTSPKNSLFENLVSLSLLNLLLFLCLIAALSPHRQVLQDWSRYRREGVFTRKGFWNRALVQDLIWNEKSPALAAIAWNLAIATVPMVAWILLLPAQGVDKITALFALACNACLIMIYAAITQLMLFMKTQNREFWAAGTLGAAIFLPPLILGVLSISPDKNIGLWLFSAFAPVALTSANASATTVFLALLDQWSILVLLTLRLNRQLRQAGESGSKKLLSNS